MNKYVIHNILLTLVVIYISVAIYGKFRNIPDDQEPVNPVNSACNEFMSHGIAQKHFEMACSLNGDSENCPILSNELYVHKNRFFCELALEAINDV